ATRGDPAASPTAAEGSPLDPTDRAGPSVPEEPRDLHDERPVPEARAPRSRVALVGPHEEELAAGLVLPPKTEIARESVRIGAVLHQRAHEHPRGERVVRAEARDGRRRGARRQVDQVEADAGLEREAV